MIRIGLTDKYWNAADKVEVKVFKGGEVNVTLPTRFTNNITKHHEVSIVANLVNSDMVMAFFLTIAAVRRINPLAELHAYLPYLPYARQDRVCNTGEALSVALFVKLLNAMDLTMVHLLDPHSDVSPAFINNCRVNTQRDLLNNLLEGELLNIKTEDLWLIAPDAGAVKKTKALAEQMARLGLVKGYMTASKSRNLMTQEITETSFDGDVTNRNVLVVDDICDGGRTFIQLGKKLREQGCKELSLLVTHGIF